MKKNKFNKLIKNPLHNIINVSKNELETLKTLFPYCEIVHNLILLKAHQENDINFTNILSVTSIYSSNRQALYNLLSQQNPTKIETSNTYHDFTTWLKSSSKKQTKIIKKSFEDNDFLTTETLAEIYVEQGHYHRAIQAYKILSLKYPKKSGFFANRINEIKNKIS